MTIKLWNHGFIRFTLNHVWIFNKEYTKRYIYKDKGQVKYDLPWILHINMGPIHIGLQSTSKIIRPY